MRWKTCAVLGFLVLGGLFRLTAQSCSLSEGCTLSSDLLGVKSDPFPPRLVLVPKDGGAEIPLPHFYSNSDRSVSWSPDGARIVFERPLTPPAGLGLWVVDADGSNEVLLASLGSNGSPRWSPDGSKIAFISDRNGDDEVYVMNADGSGQTNLSNHSGSDTAAEWSPDGSKIAFVSMRDGNAEIYVMNTNGSSKLNLSNSPADEAEPKWSPDGSKLAFTGVGGTLQVMNANGSGLTPLTVISASAPEWSPDGTRIAFYSYDSENLNYEVYLINSDGSGFTNLTNDSASMDLFPKWSPDGTQIAYFGSTGGFGLWVRYLAGGVPFQVLAGAGGPSSPFWRPLPEVPIKPGVYREGEWMLDVDGDGNYSASEDKRFFFGFEGATPFVGDWDGDGHDNVGVYAGGFWFLDYDGDGLYDGLIDKVFPYGWDDPSVKPITGDWNGDGATDIGLYVNGIWFLDSNGNHAYDGADKIFGLGGWEGSVPFVGDWDGDGADSAGIYAFGFWFLDADGDGVYDTNAGDKLYPYGWNDPSVQPQTGDWNGDGKTDVGVYANGIWFVDSDGDTLFTGADKMMALGWNDPMLVPMVGDWNGDGQDRPGVVDGGVWYLEKNGNWFFDGNDPIIYWGDDWPTEPQDVRRYLPGRW